MARDLKLEQQAIGKFGQAYGREPKTEDEWAATHRFAYPTREGLPQELVRDNTDEMYGLSPQDLAARITGIPVKPAVPTLPQNGYQQMADTAMGKKDAALGEQEKMTQGAGSFFHTLQSALREKTGAKNAGIGESELFKQAGVTGYDALFFSLSQRNRELQTSKADLTNLVNSVGDQWKAQAQVIKDRYDSAVDEYKYYNDKMEEVNSDIRKQENQIQLINLQHKLDLAKVAAQGAEDRKTDSTKTMATDKDYQQWLLAGSPGTFAEWLGKAGSVPINTGDLPTVQGVLGANAPVTTPASTKYERESDLAAVAKSLGVPDYLYQSTSAAMNGDPKKIEKWLAAKAAVQGKAWPEKGVTVPEKVTPGYTDRQAKEEARDGWLDDPRVPATVKAIIRGEEQWSTLTEKQQEANKAWFEAASASGVIPRASTAAQDKKYESLATKYRDAQLVKDSDSFANQVAIADQVLANPGNSANQLMVLYSLVKSLDPNSAVREGEIALANEAASFKQRWETFKTKIEKGQPLNPEVAKELAQGIKNLAKAYAAGKKRVDARYAADAKAVGIDDMWYDAHPPEEEEEVVVDEVAANGSPVTLKSGNTVTFK